MAFTNFQSFMAAVRAQENIYKRLGGDMFAHPVSWEMVECAKSRNVPVEIVGCDEHVIVLRVSPVRTPVAFN